MASAGELRGDRLDGVEAAALADDEVHVVVAEHHRVAGVRRLCAPADHQWPQHPKGDERQRNQRQRIPAACQPPARHRRSAPALPYVQGVDLHTNRLLIVAGAEHAGRTSQCGRKRQSGVARHPHQHPDRPGISARERRAVDVRRAAGRRVRAARQSSGSSAVSSRACHRLGARRRPPPCAPPAAAPPRRGSRVRPRRGRPDPSGSSPARSGSPTRRPPRPPRRRRGNAPARRRPSSAAGRPRRRADPGGRAAPRCRAAAPRRSRPAAAGSAPGVATTSGRFGGHGGDHRVAPGGDDGGAGKRAAEFLGGAAGADDDRAHGVGAAARAAQGRFVAAAPSAHRPRGVAVGQRQRAGAMPAAGDGAAAAACQRGHVTAAGHLNQHR